MSASKSEAVQIRRNMGGVLLAWLLAAGLAFAEEWKSAAPIPKGAEEVYGISAGGKLYVFGGLGLDWKAMGMVMEYDPGADKWTRKGDMPHGLHHVALAEVKGRIYMFETPWDLRRLQHLREWSHEKIKQVFPRGT
jgi:hypothetical protein